MSERLQKFLANSGIASRRKCEEFILSGRVQVNDKVITELGVKIDEDEDIIKFDGKIVNKNKNKAKERRSFLWKRIQR